MYRSGTLAASRGTVPPPGGAPRRSAIAVLGDAEAAEAGEVRGRVALGANPHRNHDRVVLGGEVGQLAVALHVGERCRELDGRAARIDTQHLDRANEAVTEESGHEDAKLVERVTVDVRRDDARGPRRASSAPSWVSGLARAPTGLPPARLAPRAASPDGPRR